MTRRFDGAITTPEDVLDSTAPPGAQRPSRPVSLEIAAAILIIGGLFAIVETLGATLAPDSAAAEPGARPVIVLIVLLDVLTIVVGLLVRRGQAWILCINVVAVALFVELTAVPAGNAAAVLLAAIDAFVFIAIVRNRPWFDWKTPVDDSRR